MLALCFRSVFALWGFPKPETRSSWMSWKWDGCVCLGRTDFQMPHLHTAESHMFWWNWDDLMVFLVRPSRGSNSVTWQDFVARTRKGESDLYKSYDLRDLWILMRLLSNLRLVSCAFVNVPRMFLRCMNKVSQMVRTADLRPCSSEFVIPNGPNSAVTCRFTHGEADFVRELAIQSSWQLGDRSFMSCTQGPYKNYCICHHSHQPTNSSLLKCFSISSNG